MACLNKEYVKIFQASFIKVAEKNATVVFVTNRQTEGWTDRQDTQGQNNLFPTQLEHDI